MGIINVQPKPEPGKYYKAIVDGKEGILLYVEPSRKPNHCLTCTCVENVPQYQVMDGGIIPGKTKEFRLIEEVEWSPNK